MDEGLESNPLYKDVQGYLGKVSASKSQTPLQQSDVTNASAGKKGWSFKDILSVAIPILISLVVIAVILKPPGVLKKLFTGKLVLVDVSNVTDTSSSVSDVYVSDVSDVSTQADTLQRILEGRILDIKQNPSGLQLITDIKGAENITITENTNISFLSSDELTPATLGDLKKGQAIRIKLVYLPKTGTWSVRAVSIRSKI